MFYNMKYKNDYQMIIIYNIVKTSIILKFENIIIITILNISYIFKNIKVVGNYVKESDRIEICINEIKILFYIIICGPKKGRCFLYL